MPTIAFLTTTALLALPGPAVAAKGNQDGAISEISDDRIVESSGLAVSMTHDDLVYTVNDAGNRPAVYAVRPSTGDVVGTADISSLDVEDTESITVDSDGMLWIGDLGDNDHRRDDVSILAFPEPGPGTHRITTATRYPVEFPDGPVDIEGLMVHPVTDRVYLASKNRDGNGRVYELANLTAGATATARDIGVEAPEAVTDAAFTHDGRWALLRTNDDLWIYDPNTWKALGRIDTPKLEQGESVTVERGDRTVLLGSEGKNSPLVRLALPDQPERATLADNDAGDDTAATAKSLDLAIPVGLVAVAMLAVGLVARRKLWI